MQCAWAVFCCHLWPVLLSYNIFPSYLINCGIFRRKVTENKMRVLILSTAFVNISHSKKNWGRYYQNINWSSCKAPVTLDQILTKKFIDRFSKNTQISNFMKIRPVGAEVFHTGGQTDMTKLMIAFRNFANAPQKQAGIREAPPLLTELHLKEADNSTHSSKTIHPPFLNTKWQRSRYCN